MTGWAAALHRLWGGAAAVTSRDQLAGLVLPPLLELPGVVAAVGLRHGAGGEVVGYRSVGLPVDGFVAADLADRSWLAANGVRDVLVERLDVPGEPAGTFLVLLGDGGDAALAADCLRQVVDVARDAVTRIAARRAEEEQQVGDALLAEASLQMDAVLDTAQTLQRVARMAVPAIAEGCLVYGYDDDDKPELRSAVHVDMRRLSAVLADAVAADRLRQLATDAIHGVAPRVSSPWPVEVQVLRARGRVVGVLLFVFERDPDRVPSARFLQDLAQRAALAIDNGELYERRRREVVAMQQHLLPRRLPAVAGLEMAASYTVGDRVMEVGGDFYDVVPRPHGSAAVLIGDVCGRGVDAAALTGMARHTLGALLQEGVSPARALGRLNAALLRDGSWRFVTAGVGLLRPAGDGIAVQWMSCGHPAPAVLRAGRGAEPGRGGGVPLGVLPEPSAGRSRLRLAAGDTLVAFTDGLTESRDAGGRMFEEAALWETLDRLHDRPPELLVRELSEAATAFGAAQADDIAVLAIRARGHDD